MERVADPLDVERDIKWKVRFLVAVHFVMHPHHNLYSAWLSGFLAQRTEE